MTPTTYGRDFAYCLKSHGGVRGFYASLWRFLLRCTLFCHSVATFLTSVSSYEGGCGFEDINLTQKENEAVKKQLRSLSFCVHAIQAVQRKKRKSCLKMNFGNSIVLLMSSTSVKSSKERKITLVL